MSQTACRTAWTNPGGHLSAETLDRAFPEGACECFSLASPARDAVSDTELVARVLTAPDAYDLNLQEILTSKLTSAYAGGLSVIRAGASDDEIISVMERLLKANGVVVLFGAIVIDVLSVRSPRTQFCVYDTDADGYDKHADIVGTFDFSMREKSKTAWNKEQSLRRRALRDRIAPFLIKASTKYELLEALRSAGI